MAKNFRGFCKSIWSSATSTVKNVLGLGETGAIDVTIVTPEPFKAPSVSPVYGGVDVSQYYPVIGIVGAGLLFYFLMRK